MIRPLAIGRADRADATPISAGASTLAQNAVYYAADRPPPVAAGLASIDTQRLLVQASSVLISA